MSTPRTDISWRLVAFANFLRNNEFSIGPDQLIDAHRIAATEVVYNKKPFFYSLRSIFCSNRQQWENFTGLFNEFWYYQLSETSDLNADELGHAPVGFTSSDPARLVGFAGTSSQEFEDSISGAGDYKALSLADFRFVSNAEEMQAIEQLVERIAKRAKRRFLRRKVLASRGAIPDTRRSLKSAMRNAGNLLELHYLKPQKKLPRFVLLLDVSQSMEVYAKLFLRFSCKLMGVFEHSEAYAFNTELIALGSTLDSFTESALEQRLNAQERQWLGGTRIAHSLSQFNENHANKCLDRRTTVIIFSDGYDTAPPEEISLQLRKIRSRAKRVLWVNPLLGRFKDGELDPSMAPIIPHVDACMSAHSIKSLVELESEVVR